MAGNMQYMNSAKIRHGTWNIGTLNGKRVEVCDELWKSNVDLCCLQEFRWRGCWTRLIGLQGRKYKLWWSGNQEGYGGVDVQVKEELCDKVVEVRNVNYRVRYLTIVLEEVVRVVCTYAPQSGKSFVLISLMKIYQGNQGKGDHSSHE